MSACFPSLVPASWFEYGFGKLNALRLQVSGDSANLLGYRVPLMSGDGGTAQTIRVMRRLVDQALTDQTFIRFAVDLVRNVPAYDDNGELSALYGWVLGNIRYTKDPVSKEKLYPPQELLQIRAGDCDDLAMLLGALALALGYPARLITLSADPDFPNEFSHVYTEAECPPGSGEWVPLDAARPGAQFGVEPPRYFRKRAWSLTDDSHEDLKGASMRGLGSYSDIIRERFAGLGYDDSGSILSQSISELPQIIGVVSGQPTSYNPQTGVSSTGTPYASFMTPYTPGYAVPAAGYGALSTVSGLSTSLFSSALPWLLLGVVAVAVMKK